MQGFGGKIDAGRNNAAAIIAVAIHDIEGRGGAEIDHDGRAAITLEGGNRRHQPVGADLFWPVDQDFKAKIDIVAADHHRRRAEIALAQRHQIEQRLRHDIGDDGAGDIGGGDAAQIHQLGQPDGIFVRRPFGIVHTPPHAFQVFTVIDGENDIGVSRIDGKQHRSLPTQRTRRRPRWSRARRRAIPAATRRAGPDR